MKILAIDSSGMVASVAVISEDTLLGEYTIHHKKTHSQTLLPMVDELVQMIELELGEIDAIAIAAGPGSFTGLRIGSATAKGLAFSLNKPILSVPTLEAIAYNLYGVTKVVCPMMDARNNQVFTGLYKFDEEGFCTILEQTPMTLDHLIQVINEKNEEVIFLGDGVSVYKEQLEQKLTVKHWYAPVHLLRQRAGAVAALGYEYYKKGNVDTANSHVPEYLRLSQAEREMQHKMAREEVNKEK